MMYPIEVISLVFAFLVVIKMLCILINKEFWFNHVTKKVYGSKFSPFIFVFLIVVIGYYLIQSLTLIQIFASICFGSLLIALGLISYHKGLMSIGQEFVRKGFSFWQWIYALSWLVFALYIIYLILQ